MSVGVRSLRPVGRDQMVPGGSGGVGAGVSSGSGVGLATGLSICSMRRSWLRIPTSCISAPCSASLR